MWISIIRSTLVIKSDIKLNIKFNIHTLYKNDNVGEMQAHIHGLNRSNH